MADLLLATGLTPEQATYADAVKTSAEALASLIDEILDHAKMEAGRLVLDQRPFDLRKLIEDVTELLAPRAQARGLEIACYVDDAITTELIGDKARLRQVLLNLAGNALKFTEGGGVSVLVEPSAPDAGAAGSITLRIRDTGIGIAAADLERIFEEFEQAGDGANRATSGTGLGLAISRGLVRSMGGEIAVASAPGAGATFTCAIPLPAEVGFAGPSQHARPDLSDRAVLLAAAGVIEAPLLARRLQSWGAQTRIATTAEAAAALIAAQSWDIMLVDSALGDATAHRLCSIAGDGTLKLVLVTPAARTSLPALAAAGFDGWLVKPVRTASLAARLSARVCASGRASTPASRLRQQRRTEADTSMQPRTSDAGFAILVAEDNDINALLTRSLLARLGHRPVMVTNGDDAVAACVAARAAEKPFDLILMDLQMPGLGGVEAARRIRAAEREGGAGTPIIAVTAQPLPQYQETWLAAGIDAVMAKPLDRERLQTALKAFVLHRTRA